MRIYPRPQYSPWVWSQSSATIRELVYSLKWRKMDPFSLRLRALSHMRYSSRMVFSMYLSHAASNYISRLLTPPRLLRAHARARRAHCYPRTSLEQHRPPWPHPRYNSQRTGSGLPLWRVSELGAAAPRPASFPPSRCCRGATATRLGHPRSRSSVADAGI